MQTPNFNQDQYIDAPTLNNASALVSGDFVLAAGLFKGGLVFPEAATYGVTGLAVQANLPSPFALLFSANGALAQAHGTQTGQDTQSYSVSFSGAVPASGSATAYLVATYQSIQQAPIQVIGPPVGHPDYNPNFSPYTAYTKNIDSLAVSVTTTPPDNNATFELFRCTLAAGATGIGVANTAFQQRASGPNTVQTVQVSGNYTVPLTYNGRRQQFIATNSIATLPAASGSNGMRFLFSSTVTGSCTIQTTGADLLFGGTIPSSGQASLLLAQGSAIDIEVDDGTFQILAWQRTYVTQAGATPVSGHVALWTGPTTIGDGGSLGTMAFENSNNVSITGGQISGLSEGAISTANSAAGFTATCPSPVYEWIDSNTSNAWVMQHNGGTGQLTLSFNGAGLGTFDHTTGAYSATSDERLKENVRDLDSITPRLMQLRPITYQHKGDLERRDRIGFLAQELQAIFPEFVLHIPNKILRTNDKGELIEDDASDGIPDKLGIDYSGLSVIALKAIQELAREVDALKNTIKTLTGQ